MHHGCKDDGVSSMRDIGIIQYLMRIYSMHKCGTVMSATYDTWGLAAALHHAWLQVLTGFDSYKTPNTVTTSELVIKSSDLLLADIGCTYAYHADLGVGDDACCDLRRVFPTCGDETKDAFGQASL